VSSPNKRDVKKCKDPVTGKMILQRVFHYVFCTTKIWLCACRDPKEGGFAGFRDENGDIFLSQSSFENLLPENVRRMTKSQMQMCGCEICINEHNMHKSLIEWQVATLKDFKRELANHPDKESEEYKLVKKP
jgi:hypothetical protein